jgi:Flp pilus assembly protein TadG
VRHTPGQALVELALCAPVMTLLALGVAAVVQVEDASVGLDAATHAAASAAARAPDPIAAYTAARSRFAAVVVAYPLRGATLEIALGGFSRATDVTVTSRAYVDVAWAGLVVPHRFELWSRAAMRVEPWRTHRAPL